MKMKKIIYIKYYIYNYGRMGGFRHVQMGGLGVWVGVGMSVGMASYI